MKYFGSCHCKSVQFEFESEPINSGMQCNCSICIRKNAIMSEHYIDADKFKLLTAPKALAVYHWGDKDVNHYFCQVCGIHPFHDTIYELGKYRINLGCVENLEARTLKIFEFDGKNEL